MLKTQSYGNYKLGLVLIDYIVDGNEVGSCSFKIKNDNTLIIEGVSVWSNYQGKGYATKMMKEVVAFYKEQFKSVYPNLVLRVFADNVPALKAYIHSGFKTYEMEPPYGEDIILGMKLA